MKIAKYIADLLFEYECIVIPGLGGFITKEKTSKIHPVQHQFIPPSKEIVFNVHLTTNDGLLVNHIARKENLTYIEARTSIERFVEKCLAELNNGKKIRFHKIGILFMDAEKNMLFEPDKTQNYSADSFGLKGFVSPPIKRTMIRPSIKTTKTTTKKDRSPKETAKREIEPTVKGPKYIKINISFILIVIISTVFVFYRFSTVKQYYNNYASIFPFFYSSPNEYIVKNLDEPSLMSVFTFVDKLNSKITNQKTEKDTIKKIKEDVKLIDTLTSNKDAEPEKTDQQTTSKKPIDTETPVPLNRTEIASKIEYKHFIIAGAFRDKNNADRLMQNLKAKGFNAMIVEQNKYGLYRVCFDAFSDVYEANKNLAVIRREEESQAWLLSI